MDIVKRMIDLKGVVGESNDIIHDWIDQGTSNSDGDESEQFYVDLMLFILDLNLKSSTI